jgi:formamidopyrimidine-DNA glycosylase
VRLARTIAYPEEADRFLAGLQGTQLVGWHRRGKYLLGELKQPQTGADEIKAGKIKVDKLKADKLKADNLKADQTNTRAAQPEPALKAAGWLGVHLRMTGQLLWVDQDEDLQTHCRVRLFFDGNRELRYVDQRTFGRLWWVPPGQAVEGVMSGLTRLGPEPFSDEFSAAYLGAALKGRQRPIKNALLDQQLVAGIGNIYADEALFISGIRPKVVGASLSAKRIARLHEAIVQVLTTSIESGGTTFSDFRDIHGINGNYGGVAWVYGRKGEPCRKCGSEIVRLQLAGRSAHYCPKCQK